MKSLHGKRPDGRGAAFVAIWSSGYIGGSIAASVIAPLAANLWRFVLGAVVLAAIARAAGGVAARGTRPGAGGRDRRPALHGAVRRPLHRHGRRHAGVDDSTDRLLLTVAGRRRRRRPWAGTGSRPGSGPASRWVSPVSSSPWSTASADLRRSQRSAGRCSAWQDSPRAPPSGATAHDGWSCGARRDRDRGRGPGDGSLGATRRLPAHSRTRPGRSAPSSGSPSSPASPARCCSSP